MSLGTNIVYGNKDDCQRIFQFFGESSEHKITKTERYRIFTDFDGKITGYYRQYSNAYTGTYSWYPTDFHKLSGNRRYYYAAGMYYWKLYSCYENQCIYPHTLKSAIKGTAYEHLPPLFSYTKEPNDVTTLLENAQHPPIMEMIEKLTKVGLSNLATWFSQCTDSYKSAKEKGIHFEGTAQNC